MDLWCEIFFVLREAKKPNGDMKIFNPCRL